MVKEISSYSYYRENLDSFDRGKSYVADRRYRYLMSKKEPLVCDSLEEITSMNVIKILEKIGFSTNEVGTFLYSDIITKIIYILEYLDKNDFFFNDCTNRNFKKTGTETDCLNNITIGIKEKILKSLNDPYSYFYYSLAIEKNEISLNIYHNYLKKAFSNINKDKKFYNVIPILSSYNDDSLNYGELAFILAVYIYNNNELLDIDKILEFKEEQKELGVVYNYLLKKDMGKKL